MDLFVVLTIAVIAMFISFRAVVDFSNDKDLTINEWVELNIERVRNLFRKKR